MSEIVTEPIAVVADNVAKVVATNSESINTISRVMSDLFDIVSANGQAIQSLKSFSNALAEFSTATFQSVISATQRVMSIAAENADNLSYLEMVTERMAEHVDKLTLLTKVSLGIGVFNTFVIFGLILVLLRVKK